jgi:hypothetical protein
MNEIPDAIADAVRERAGGYCEACGGPIRPGDLIDGAALHHRYPLSGGIPPPGGFHTLANLMQAHHSCHNVAPGSIHQNPNRSKRLGHIVRRGEDPAAIGITVVPRLRELRQ